MNTMPTSSLVILFPAVLVLRVDRQTDRQTDRHNHTQTRMIDILTRFLSAWLARTKCNVFKLLDGL